MTYIKTKLKRSIDIDAIITLHYFEYMKNFEFKGESHNFWEFLYVDKGTVAVRADDTWTTLKTGDIIFHQPNEFHAIKSIGKDSPNLVVMSFTCDSPAMDFFIRRNFTLSMERTFHDIADHHRSPADVFHANAYSFCRTGRVKRQYTVCFTADDPSLP